MNLPGVETITADLRRFSLAEVARQYGVTASAICVKLRRAGMPRGNSVTKKPKRVIPPMSTVEPLMAIDRVVRTTFSGAKVTMPRVSFIDGLALQPKEGE